MPYRIIKYSYWEDGKTKSLVFVEKRKKFWRWSWWSRIQESIGIDLQVNRDFETVEKAEAWITSRESWKRHYGSMDGVSEVVKVIG